MRIHKAFIAQYSKFDTKAISTQTAYLLALAFDLLPESERAVIAQKLAGRIHADGDRLSKGFLGTLHLLPVLSRFRYHNLASIALSKRISFVALSHHPGATTMWEKWDAIRPDGTIQQTSFNHFAYGAVGEWFYQSIAGITSLESGFKKVLIAPQPHHDLKWAKADYKTQLGLIKVKWKLKGSTVSLDVTLPEGLSASIAWPNAAGRNLLGRYNIL